MTLPTFEKNLDFVLLDEPEEVTTLHNRKVLVVALATENKESERGFLFALAVEKVSETRQRLTILSRWITPHGKEKWIDARKILFHHWVKEWLTNHPEQLIQIGFVLGRTYKE